VQLYYCVSIGTQSLNSVLNIYVYRARHYTKLAVECRPVEVGRYSGLLSLLASTGVKLTVPLTAQYVKETAI